MSCFFNLKQLIYVRTYLNTVTTCLLTQDYFKLYYCLTHEKNIQFKKEVYHYYKIYKTIYKTWSRISKIIVQPPAKMNLLNKKGNFGGFMSERTNEYTHCPRARVELRTYSFLEVG